MKSTFWMTAQEAENEIKSRTQRHSMRTTKPIKVERKGTYQGVPQWGITGQAEITPSKATAEKWAQLENANRNK